MGFLKRLFGNKHNTQVISPASVELTELFELNKEMTRLLAGDHYVARSEYIDILTVSA